MWTMCNCLCMQVCVVYATVKVDDVRIENYLCTSMLNINKYVFGFQLL